MHEELDADQISVGAFFGRLRDQYRLVPLDVDADGDCLLHTFNQGMIWMAEDGLWDWRYILDHKEARASLMDELHDNSGIY